VQTSTKKRILEAVLAICTTVGGGIFYLWHSGRIEELPLIALAMGGAAIPVFIALAAIYLAAKPREGETGDK